MKAAVVHDFNRPLAIEDVPIPEPGPEQVLVRIESSGLCHTDIHAARGEWPVKPALPFIPGHEGVGIIERIGSGNRHGLEEGMRVALPWLGYACGDCATATPAGRRSASPSRTRATRSTAGSPSTPSATRATPSACPTASIRPTRRR